MATQRTIYFDADGLNLVGTLHLPSDANPPVVIGCHGLLANRHSPKQISLASACTRNGMAYFRFDHRGCGDSQGKFSEVTSLASRRHDLYHAVETMQHHSKVGPVHGLFGSSFGGTVILDYASEHTCPALITYAAPIRSEDIHHKQIRDNNGKVLPSSFLTDGLVFDISSKLSSVSNILICHSQGDETVPVEHAHQIYSLTMSPKQLHIFQGGDHRMSTMSHQQQFEAMFIDWIVQIQNRII